MLSDNKNILITHPELKYNISKKNVIKRIGIVCADNMTVRLGGCICLSVQEYAAGAGNVKARQ